MNPPQDGEPTRRSDAPSASSPTANTSASDASERRSSAPGAVAGKPDVARRFLARLIDGVIAGVAYTIVSLIAPGSFLGPLLGGLAGAAYLLVCDGLELRFMKRRSLGKRILNLRLRTLDGRPMNLEKSALRNWMFAIGYFSVIPLVGWLIALIGLGLVLYECYLVLTDAEGRRWGDRLAETKVVEDAS